MNKLIKRFALLSVGLAMAIGAGVASFAHTKAEVAKADSNVTFTAGTDKGETSVVKDGITISMSTMSRDDNYRTYANSDMTVTCDTSLISAITGVEVTCTGSGTANYGPGKFSGTDYTYSGTVGTWSGSATSVSLSASAQVRMTKIVVSYTPAETGKAMKLQDNYHTPGPFEVTYGDTEDYKYVCAWDAEADQPLNSGCTWTVSNESVIDYSVDGYTWLKYKPKNVGTTTVTCEHEGFASKSTTITVVPGTLQSIVVSGSMSKTSYTTSDSWDHSGLVATATYDSGYSYDAADDATWTYNPAAPAKDVTSVVATATMGEVSGSSAAQAVTVTRINPIAGLYTKASGASVDVYGYYVGFLDGTGPVIMDGEYGIVIYNKTADVSGYTVKETILHVTGSISIYKGLYEIGSAAMAIATSVPEGSIPSTPVTYATQGGETADYASRLTTVTGVPTVTSGSFDADAGTSDIKMNFAVGTKTVQVFYKMAAQTADAEAFAAIKAAATAEPATEITVKGFTGWYDGFQVQMNGYVPAAEGFTAAEFAQILLDSTKDLCDAYEDGVSSFASYKEQLDGIWSDLSDANGEKTYPKLPSDQKQALADAEAKESGTVIEQAMARYDFLTVKYGLSNFINGRLEAESTVTAIDNANNSSVILIVAVISATSLVAFGSLLIIKKKHN